jgi:hypothetical protein
MTWRALIISPWLQGLEVLAFPCNQFGAQEPGTDAEVKVGLTLPSFFMYPKWRSPILE